MSTAQAAIPHASAANSAAARPGTRPWGSPESTRPAGTAALLTVTRATGLVRSMLSSGVSVTSLASTATQARASPCPAGRISRSARPAPVTGPQVPSITRPPPSPGEAPSPGPSPTAAVSVPAASSLTRLSSAEVSAPSAAAPIALASTAPASTVGRNPPGTSARASSSAATASSGRPAPCPPSASGRCRPSSPWAARPGRSVSRYRAAPWSSASTADLITGAGAACPAQPRTDSASARCSSVRASVIAHLTRRKPRSGLTLRRR